MFEFEVIQDLKPNDEILEIIKTHEYTVKNGIFDDNDNCNTTVNFL